MTNHETYPIQNLKRHDWPRNKYKYAMNSNGVTFSRQITYEANSNISVVLCIESLVKRPRTSTQMNTHKQQV